MIAKRALTANWRRLKKDYHLTDKLLGDGTFGRVFLGTSAADGSTAVAIKIPKIETIIDNDEENGMENAWAAVKKGEQEVQILARLASAVDDDDDGSSSSSSSSPFIMPPILASFIVSDERHNLPILATVMHYYPNGTLEDLIESKPFGGLDEWQARIIARQLLLAVAHLVKHGIVHRDIKPENLAVLLDPRTNNFDKIVLIDFGTAKVFTNQILRTFCGSDFFRATEIGKAKSYSPSVDLYSCGMTLLVVLYGYFTDRKARDLYLRQTAVAAARKARCEEPLLVWHTVWNLQEVYNSRDNAPNPFVENILQLAEKRPKKRPTLADALRLFHHVETAQQAKDFATATAQLARPY